MTPEEISGGREPRRWVGPTALVLAVLVGLALLANDLVRRSERSALRTCVTTAESDLDDLAYGDDAEGVFDEAVGQFGDVDEAVLLDADIDKGAEIDDVAYGAL